MQARLSVELGYAIVEMVLEDASLDSALVIREGAAVIRMYWQGILGQVD